VASWRAIGQTPPISTFHEPVPWQLRAPVGCVTIGPRKLQTRVGSSRPEISSSNNRFFASFPQFACPKQPRLSIHNRRSDDIHINILHNKIILVKIINLMSIISTIIQIILNIPSMIIPNFILQIIINIFIVFRRHRHINIPIINHHIALDAHRNIIKNMIINIINRIGCPTSSVAQANLTIEINFNRLHSFSSSDILTIYLHAFLQSLQPFEKNCVQGLPRDFCQHNPNTNKKFR
jgi:hypothetical protein